MAHVRPPSRAICCAGSLDGHIEAYTYWPSYLWMRVNRSTGALIESNAHPDDEEFHRLRYAAKRYRNAPNSEAA